MAGSNAASSSSGPTPRHTHEALPSSESLRPLREARQSFGREVRASEPAACTQRAVEPGRSASASGGAQACPELVDGHDPHVALVAEPERRRRLACCRVTGTPRAERRRQQRVVVASVTTKPGSPSSRSARAQW